MLKMWLKRKRRRDQERVLSALWQTGLSRSRAEDIAGAARLSLMRTESALSVLEAVRLVTCDKRNRTWALTTVGHKRAASHSAAHRSHPR